MKFLFLTGIALLCAGCGGDVVDFSQIADPRQRWNAYNFSEYSIVQTFSSRVGRRVRVHVRNGEVVVAIDTQSGDTLSPQERSWCRSVDSLFAEIERARKDSVAWLQLEFNPKFGYPATVFVDPSLAYADEEYGWQSDSLLPASAPIQSFK